MPELGRTTPCSECPWRTTSLAGYVGDDNPVHFYWVSIAGEAEMPCHEQIDYSDPDWEETQLPGADLCAGTLIHFRNSIKHPRNPKLAAAVDAVKRSNAVFTWPWDWFMHHMSVGLEEAKRLTAKVQYPGLNPEDDDA